MTDHAAAAALAVRPAPAAPAEVGIAGELVAHVVAVLPALAVLDQRGSVAGRGLAGVAALGPCPPCFATDLLAWRTWLAERRLEPSAAVMPPA